MGVLIANALAEHTELGLRPLGFLDALPPPDEQLPLPLIGAAGDLPEESLAQWVREHLKRG